ncbi:helix-turn-helix transcriptional regulator [Trueperella pecoris]|uniref:Helix-turn-helix transcriptional regulator n=1 Tax=Trueperella pecoris TaxID=2733571 RepID=A0A7M1QYF4_9ACTO|nr:helix-turn-helix transcriptional regulator [Trueperella pecoris]QOQ38662.1 helix-turn-helix transcriptional regulator [Trueperella pecoris]QOR44846.1 helix-turn-helix transcriptional regulator [Trueperella pecoris]QOR46851.1 helix-turn-helix transcriptional regulator [Trueperella pecoris]QTG74769.1 helix-turn-helix transcriptional regulator [Trueperella pecoris]
MKNDIVELRRERGWSQQLLADKLGVSRQTIISIEKGRFDPSLPLAFDIACVFGKTIEAVFFPDRCLSTFHESV